MAKHPRQLALASCQPVEARKGEPTESSARHVMGIGGTTVHSCLVSSAEMRVRSSGERAMAVVRVPRSKD